MRRSPSLQRVLLLLAALSSLGSECTGDGGGGKAPVIEITNARRDCLTLAGAFPSGFDLLPDASGNRNGNGAVVQFTPPALLGLDLATSPPQLLATNPIPSLFPNGDSDSDGIEDGTRSNDAGFFFRTPLPGGLNAIAENLGLVSTTNYEQVMFVNPLDGGLVEVSVSTPPGFAVGEYPFLPAPGTSAPRTAISTRVCIEPPRNTDSAANALGASTQCPPPTQPGGSTFYTRLTAGAAVAAGHLFVATSNLLSSAQGRFAPGTVLIYEFDTSVTPHVVRPSPVAPVLFTTHFNPTQITDYTTPSGRELVLVTNTGAIGASSGGTNILSAASVDVIDGARLELVATIPLGLAGPAFDKIAISADGRVGLLGSTSELSIFAIDLQPLDDPTLYLNPGAPILLDGTVPGFSDARIHSADNPLQLPDRADGPDPALCAGLTSVAIGGDGQLAYASDFCDGTLATLLVDGPNAQVAVLGSSDSFAPNTPTSLTQLRTPGAIRIKTGTAGTDFIGPEFFVVAGSPEGAVCAFSSAP